MAKAKRTPKRQRQTDAKEQSLLDERKRLRRVDRLHREIAKLTRRLASAVSVADETLLDFCRLTLQANGYDVTVALRAVDAPGSAVQS